MKKLFAILILSISLIGIGNAQITTTANGGLFWSDSLFQDYVGVTVDSTVQSSTLRLGFNYDWMSITGVDTTGGAVDSCVIEFGILQPSNDSVEIGVLNYEVSDTMWTLVPFMRDSSWTNTNGAFLPANASTKSYQVFVGNYDLIRVRMTNATIIPSRVWRFYAILSRKK